MWQIIFLLLWKVLKNYYNNLVFFARNLNNVFIFNNHKENLCFLANLMERGMKEQYN